jgi:imidazolonepropionase-like amidohydrolase
LRHFLMAGLTWFALGTFATAADVAGLTYVRAGKLLDVRSGRMLADQVIVIHGDRIERLGPSNQVQIPPGAHIVDLSHATVLPGLIDCHTHIMLSDTDNSHYDDILLKQSWQYRTILATLNVKRDLEAGFTAMRDVETEGAMYSDVDVRNAINEGLIPGPRLKVATRGVWSGGLLSRSHCSRWRPNHRQS